MASYSRELALGAAAAPGLLHLALLLLSHTMLLGNPSCSASSPSSSSSSVLSSVLDLPHCAGRKVYTIPLPPRFNLQLLFDRERDAAEPAEWWTTRMLEHLERATPNRGFGLEIPPVMGQGDMQGAWYQTDENTLDWIFYSRMLTYPCAVSSHEDADLVYVPYFGGHATLRNMHKDVLRRDRLGMELMGILREHPAWARQQGGDFFMVLGRNLWDYYRNNGTWGSNLLNLPGVNGNIWIIVAETARDMERVVSVPKPTGFHPRDRGQLERWQEFVGVSERRRLFSIVAGHRGVRTKEGVFREMLFWQCGRSGGDCEHLDCDKAPCHDANRYFGLYLSSHFCLHPIGDACTRRSVLDAALAGCIPVVFTECTLQEQFDWHLGSDKSGLFVNIPLEDVKGPEEGVDYSHWPELGKGPVVINEVLRAIPMETVVAMRNRIISLVPKLVYGGQLQEGAVRAPDFKDSVDVILEGLANGVRTQ